MTVFTEFEHSASIFKKDLWNPNLNIYTKTQYNSDLISHPPNFLKMIQNLPTRKTNIS